MISSCWLMEIMLSLRGCAITWSKGDNSILIFYFFAYFHWKIHQFKHECVTTAVKSHDNLCDTQIMPSFFLFFHTRAMDAGKFEWKQQKQTLEVNVITFRMAEGPRPDKNIWTAGDLKRGYFCRMDVVWLQKVWQGPENYLCHRSVTTTDSNATSLFYSLCKNYQRVWIFNGEEPQKNSAQNKLDFCHINQPYSR